MTKPGWVNPLKEEERKNEHLVGNPKQTQEDKRHKPTNESLNSPRTTARVQEQRVRNDCDQCVREAQLEECNRAYGRRNGTLETNNQKTVGETVEETETRKKRKGRGGREQHNKGNNYDKSSTL